MEAGRTSLTHAVRLVLAGGIKKHNEKNRGTKRFIGMKEGQMLQNQLKKEVNVGFWKWKKQVK